MTILIIIGALLMTYVGAQPDLKQAERIVQSLDHVDDKYKQDILIIIAIESSFNEKATSSAGARGLMQLTPIAVQDIVDNRRCDILEYPKDIYNIEDNIAIGSCFYQYLMVLYNNRDEALAHYNGGFAAVEKLRLGQPYKETKGYLKRFKQLEKKIPINAFCRKDND